MPTDWIDFHPDPRRKRKRRPTISSIEVAVMVAFLIGMIAAGLVVGIGLLITWIGAW